MNWDNQNKDPWGGKNDAPDFDDLVKKFSSILGGKKHPPMARVVIPEVVLKYRLLGFFYTVYLPSQ